MKFKNEKISRIDKPNANNFKNVKDKKIANHYMKFKEGYYDSINDMQITDVFQNFENKYGKDNTTELTTFKDMNQKDGFPPHGKDRGNLFKAVHERDKNIGIESKVFSHKNYLKEEECFNMYNENFLEGYLDALNEACSCGSKKCPICAKKKKIVDECNGSSCNEDYNDIFIQGYYDALAEGEDCEGCCDGEETTSKKEVIDSVDGEASKISQPNANGLVYDADENQPITNRYMAFEEGYNDCYDDILNESEKAEKIAAGAILGAGAVGLGKAIVHNYKMDNDLNYRKDYMGKQRAKKEAKLKKLYAKYKAKGGKLPYSKWLNAANREYEKYKIDGGKDSQKDYEQKKKDEIKRRKAAAEAFKKQMEEDEEKRMQRKERQARLNNINSMTERNRAMAKRMSGN